MENANIKMVNTNLSSVVVISNVEPLNEGNYKCYSYHRYHIYEDFGYLFVSSECLIIVIML